MVTAVTLKENNMGTRLIVDGNAVYEIDEECCTCGQRYGGRKPQEAEKETEKEAE